MLPVPQFAAFHTYGSLTIPPSSSSLGAVRSAGFGLGICQPFHVPVKECNSPLPWVPRAPAGSCPASEISLWEFVAGKTSLKVQQELIKKIKSEVCNRFTAVQSKGVLERRALVPWIIPRGLFGKVNSRHGSSFWLCLSLGL